MMNADPSTHPTFKLPQNKHLFRLYLVLKWSAKLFFGRNQNKISVDKAKTDMLLILIYVITLTAWSIEEPLASSAAMHDAKVQPVPCVLRVFMREERSSKMLSPGIIIFNNRICYKHKVRKAMLLTDSSLKHTIEEDINSIR